MTKTTRNGADTRPEVGGGVTPDGWLRVATIGRPHGVSGEVRLWLDNPDSELLYDALERPASTPLRLVPARGDVVATRLLGLRPGGDALLARFDGVAGRDEAAKLTHAEVQVPRSVLPPPGEGEFYHVDVVGADVFDAADDAHLGVVRAVATTSVELLVIALDDGGEVMVPIIEAYVVSIGETPGRVVVRDLDHWT